MMKFKDKGVDGNVKGVAFLFKKNKIDGVHGTGRIAAPGKVEVKAADGRGADARNQGHCHSHRLRCGQAAWHRDRRETHRVITGALVLDRVPRRLLVIGAGVIGLELGSVWRRLGSEVMVVEFLDRILPGVDSEVCRQFQRMLEKQGITFRLSSKVTASRSRAATQGHGGAGRRRHGGNNRGRRRAGVDRARALHQGSGSKKPA